MVDPIDEAGGKGTNLLRMRDGGFPVPPFVILGAHEYRDFVAAHGLGDVIREALVLPAPEASERIREAFRRPMDTGQRRRILDEVGSLLDGPVAVRSSATAEDLPDASFAGQLDSFLDVVGADALLEAVVECFSSLWTGRAIRYREQVGIGHDDVALAVVVQEMVPADVAGVMFTADPLSGLRGRVVIDAVRGLAERLVQGTVSPEHLEIDDAGDVERSGTGAESTLSDAQAKQLAALGRRIEVEFGAPQDVEWTLAAGEFQVVQSRPITTLFPLPEGSPTDALWFSGGAFQGVLDPITPLGREVLGAMVAGISTLVGREVDHRDDPYLRAAGERLWVRLDGVLRTSVGQRIAPMLRMIDPNAAAVVVALRDEYLPVRGGSARVVRRVLPFVRRVAPGIVRGMWDPPSARRRVEHVGAQLVGRTAARLAMVRGCPRRRLAARLDAVRAFAADAFPTMLPVMAPIMVPSVAATVRLRTLAERSGVPDAQSLVLQVMGSLPGNVTAEMDRELWDAADAIRNDPESRRCFETVDPAVLAERCLQGRLPSVAQRVMTRFLRDHGMRGPGEIDLGTPRWDEAPEAVLRSVVGYLGVPPEQSPRALFDEGRRRAHASLRSLEEAADGWRTRQVRFLGSRLRGLFGARETPKFAMVRCLSLLRRALLASGADLVDVGRLDHAEDVFFLSLDELARAFDDATLGGVVAARRRARERERRRTRVPVVITGDGRTYYEAPGRVTGDITGTGVSPGTAEGAVRVVVDPATSELQPGEILVCRGTDPAWTPLFLVAGGLVTEVGGLMTHGAVVARESGLPAVVGVADATTTLRSGQRIRIDGSSGAITLLD